ncbi:MAG TPA: class I SAM-dependent methyltransferase [Thermoleophilaceae bacterium]
MTHQTHDEIREANVRYHDVAATDYDAKWGISYGPEGRAQVVGKMRRALGGEAHFGRSLEIGAGTGYFTLNLLRAGMVDEAVATDISLGMLHELEETARRLGVAVETVQCEADTLPFPDDSFDLVFGHAVLHHLPDLDAAFAEFRRVLRPGGRIAFAGEPSRHGDRIAGVPKRAAMAIAPAWRRLVGARERALPGHDADDHWLEHVVDVHAFTPGQLEEVADRAGFEYVRVTGEELVAGLFGWLNRTLESTAEPSDVPMPWIRYAYYGYLGLKQVDRRLLEGRLPPAIFYNLLVSATAPPGDSQAAAARYRSSASRRASRWSTNGAG